MAAAFAEKDRTLDVDLIKEARTMLKKRQGIFSNFRSYNELTVSARMALSASPEQYIDEVIEVYNKFQKGKIFGSSYRVLASMSICDQGKYSVADELIEKTYAILKGMNKAHPFLTTDEDTCFAVLLAMTDKSVVDILSELEVADFLKGKKGFGVLDMGKETRLMFGSMLVSGAYMSGDYKTKGTGIGGEIGRIVALQTAIFITMMIVMTTTVAASASH